MAKDRMNQPEHKLKKRLQHCSLCPSLEDTFIKLAVPQTTVQELLHAVASSDITVEEKSSALLRLSMDPEALSKLLSEPYVQSVLHVVETNIDEGAKIVANCCAAAVPSSKVMGQIVKKLMQNACSKPMHEHPQVLRAIANILIENHDYATDVKPVIPHLIQSIAKHEMVEIIRCIACFATVPSLARQLYSHGAARECHRLSKQDGKIAGYAITSKDWMSETCDTAPKEDDYSYLNITPVASEFTDVHPVAKAFRPHLGKGYSNFLIGKAYFSNCPTDGVIRLCASQILQTEIVFVSLLYQPINNELRDTMIQIFSTKEKQQMVQFLDMYLKGNLFYKKHAELTLAPISFQDANELFRIVAGKQKLDEDTQTVGSFFQIFAQNAPKQVAKSVIEFYKRKLPKPQVATYNFNFSQWRSILSSDLFGEWSFKLGDLMELGARVAYLRGNFNPKTPYDDLPNPSLFAKDWITETLFLAKNCAHSVQMLLSMFGHCAFFFSMHGNQEIAHDATLAFYHVMAKGDFRQCPPIVAFVERTVYYCAPKDHPLPLMLQMYKTQGLPAVIKHLIDGSREKLPSGAFPRNKIVEPLVDYIMKQLHLYKTKQASFKPTTMALLSFLQECFQKKLLHQVDGWTATMMMTEANTMAQLLLQIWDDINLDTSKGQYADFEQYVQLQTQFANPNDRQLYKDVNVCARCGAKASSNCSRCKKVKYCSKECQTKHWPEHKSQCK